MNDHESSLRKDPDLRVCERCGIETYSWGADACVWWPDGCSGPDQRICGDCQTVPEKRELAARGCASAAAHGDV